MDKTIYWGRMQIQQKIGNIENIIIKNFVKIEISESSQLSFLKVVNLHAMDAKLNIEIIGVIKGKTKINNINIAFNPKKNLSRSGTIPTVLSINSIALESLVANKIRKNNQETLKTNGHNIFNIQKFNLGSFENHSSKFTILKIKKIRIGTKIIEINTNNRLKITPFISFDMISLISLIMF
jgi:hypothetical protein